MGAKTVLFVIVFYLSLCFNLSHGADSQRLSAKDILNFHNYYRCLHGTQPLAWDNGLAASAQEWAYNRQNTASCQMQHSGYAQLGENVAAGTWRGLTGFNFWGSEDDVVNGWYHEPFTYGSSSIQYNHFTQILWQGTTHVGCSWAPCNSSEYEFWVCQYTPAGNMMNAQIINQNVPKPCRTRQQCEFTLQGINLLNKFGTQAKIDTALTANQINPTTYNYAAQSCLTTSISAYTPQATPMCLTDSTVLPKNLDVTVTNPTSTGALTVKLNCPNGKALSGTGVVSCTSGNSWNIAGSCGGVPVTAAPSPNNPPPPPPPVNTPPPPPVNTPAPASGCWGAEQANTYLAQYPSGWTYTAQLTLSQAKTACLAATGCNGLTRTASGWEPRAGTTLYASTQGESSILRLASCTTPATNAPVTHAPPPPPPPSTPLPPPPTGGKCYGSLLTNKYLYLYPNGYNPPATSTLQQAQAACNQYADCGGVTWTGTSWEARQGTTPMASTGGEMTYLVVPCGGTGTVSVWSSSGVAYKKGQCVQYLGGNYVCLQSHTSLVGWDPVSAASLWSKVTTCPASSAEVESSIQERIPWLIPTVACVIGVLIISISIMLYKTHKQRYRAYSGDLGTPELPTNSQKVEEDVLIAPVSPTTTTDQPPPLESGNTILQNQPTYSQIPTSPIPTSPIPTNENFSQTFPLSPSANRSDQPEFPSSQDQAPVLSEPQPKPSPTEWETRTDPTSGQPYYYNHTTGVTQWEVPDGS